MTQTSLCGHANLYAKGQEQLSHSGGKNKTRGIAVPDYYTVREIKRVWH